MTVGEIMMVGENIGKKYVDEISSQMVKEMIAGRLGELKEKLEDTRYSSSHKQIREKISILEKAEGTEFHQALVNENRNRLMNHFRNAAENMNTDLNNAEYFGYSGRLR